MERLKLLSHNRVKLVEQKGKQVCQECSINTRVTRLQRASARMASPREQPSQTSEVARRALKRMEAEARKSRRALSALLAQLRRPLAGSPLWPTTRVAAALCSGSF